MSKIVKVDAECFIEGFNRVDGNNASRWRKHGMDRIYLNFIDGVKSHAYLVVGEGGELSMGQYSSPLELPELIRRAAEGLKQLEGESAQGPSQSWGRWKAAPGGGRIRFDPSGTFFEVDGVEQSDLNDYLG